MERATVQVPCPDCRLTSETSDPGPVRWHCPRCGRFYFLRRCSVCGLVSHVSGFQGWRQPWECVWCKAINTGFTQNKDPATATVGELADDVAGHDLAFAPPEPPAAPAPPPAQAPPQAQAPAAARAPAPQATIVLPIGGIAGIGADPAPAVGPGPLPGQAPAAPRPRRSGRLTALAALAAAVIALVAALTARAAPGGPRNDGPAAPQAFSGTTRSVSVSVGAVGAVDLQAAPGLLTIVGTGADRVTLTGQLQWTGRAPDTVTRLDRATSTLQLSYTCAPVSPCTENYRLAVPDGTATVLRLPSGRLVLSGLGGPVRITAASVNVTATGLRSPTLAVAITSGRLSASFSRAPRQVSIALTSAQATLRLPGSAVYRISQHVTSGSVRVAVPQAATAADTVTAFLTSSDLQLLRRDLPPAAAGGTDDSATVAPPLPGHGAGALPR